MAKGKKGKKGTEETKKEYTLITLEEQLARELKYTNRLNDLKVCRSFLDDALTAVAIIKKKQHQEEKWETYLRVDGLPKPYLPPEIRLFFEKLRHFEGLNIEKTIDWVLSVDERSVLTQDIFHKDLTRRVLINEIRPNIGLEYEKNIDYLLKVLKSIEYYIEDNENTGFANHRIFIDISEQKKAVHDEIMKFFNSYAYRILSSEDSYMDDVNATTAEYFYRCDNFRIHIWTLKNVPILFEFLLTPYIIANLHNLDVELIIPFSILEENLTIRGIHLEFDPFSEHAKSYMQEITVPTEHLTAGMPDLYDCLINEYILQIRIQTEVRNEMIKRREEYDEKAKQLAEQQEQQKKKSGKPNETKPKKEKPIKLPKEPPIIPPDVFPDISEDFLAAENGNFNDFINSVYHPDKLNLNSNELNLKKYMILGGVYQFYFVEKPTHYRFQDFGMTWHEHDGQLQIKHDVVALENAITEDLTARLSRMSRMSRSLRFSLAPSASRKSVPLGGKASQRSLNVRPSKAAFDQAPDDLLWHFVLTIVLPKYLCQWGKPEPYHFKADLIGYVDEVGEVARDEATATATATGTAVDPSISARKFGGPSEVVSTFGGTTFTGTNTPILSAITNPLLKTEDAASTALMEYGEHLSTEDPNVRIHSSLHSYSPRSSNIFRRSTSSHIFSMGGIWQPSRDVLVDDFRLDVPLSIVQIRNIQRHCLPRIISSFKFPVEVQDDLQEEMRGKVKGKGGILVRKRAENLTQSTPEKQQATFQFDEQNNPERLFPYFSEPDMLNLNVLKEFIDEQPNEPETFGQFIEIMDMMKYSYQQSSQKTMRVPAFKTKINYQKLRLRGKSFIPERQSSARETSMIKAVSTAYSGHSISSAHRSRSKSRGRVIEVKSDMDLKAIKERKEREKLEREIAALRSTVKLIVEEGEEEEEEEEEEGLSQHIEEEEPKDTRETFKYSHWTNEHIISTTFSKENSTITIHTDRLGTIGLAFKRYEHFPFKDWTVEPSPENPETEIMFTLETQFVRCVIYITAKGYRGYVCEPTKGFVRNREKYLEITEPITDFRELKKRFRERFLNIFSDHDARFYIENGYFSEKHLAAELHTYSCIALHCLMMKFARSNWNRLAQRRDILLLFSQNREPAENMIQVRITPENASFVDVKELCSDNLNVFQLDYGLTWRNIDTYSDFHHLIMSCYLSALESRCKDPKLMVNLKNLLCEIRPLSYS